MVLLKRKLFLKAATILILAAFQISTQAQTRIRFRRGSSSATVAGQLSSRQLQRVYVIGARAGQILAVRVTVKGEDATDFALFNIDSPSGKALTAGEQETQINLPENGDYRITITPPAAFYQEKLRGYKRLRFSLFVRID